MRNRIICAVAVLLVGCGEDASILVQGSTNVDTLSIGNAEDGVSEKDTTPPVEDTSEETDAEETEDVTVPKEPCQTGSVRGVLCNPGALPEQSCTQLAMESTCGSEAVSISSPLPDGGAFIFEEVPSGVQTLQIDIGWIQATCTLLVEPGKENLVTINDCSCAEGEDCSSLFEAACWPEDFADDCNCRDDDCDGEQDEDCFDGCDCIDSDCDGQVDEDCVDGCDGVDDDCDGVKDEDCPYVNQCLPISQGTEFDDCDNNGLSDSCPTCPAAEVVFVLDTSGTMDDELEELCNGITAIQAALDVVNIEISVEILGITEEVDCASDTVVSVYGNIPKDPIDSLPQLLLCSDDVGNSEDWGAATAVVAANKQWAEKGIKMIIPISDEAPICGNPFDADDLHGMEAVNVFVAGLGVVVYPISATGTSAEVIEVSKALAEATGGQWNESTAPEEDLILHVLGGVFDACFKAGDCDKNGIPDTCDLNTDPGLDCDGDGLLDGCHFDPTDVAMDCNGNGEFDACELNAGTALDCNENGIPDACDVNGEGFSDCDLNGIPDSCDVEDPSLDCNGNKIPDACDLIDGLDTDCNGNGILDTCATEEAKGDCDANDVLDICDIAADPALDCDSDGAIDNCAITDGTVTDCNGNNAPDACDVAQAPELDCDENGSLDSCEIAGGTGEDCDGNGALDSCQVNQDPALDCDVNGIPDGCQLTPETDINGDQILDVCQP